MVTASLRLQKVEQVLDEELLKRVKFIHLDLEIVEQMVILMQEILKEMMFNGMLPIQEEFSVGVVVMVVDVHI